MSAPDPIDSLKTSTLALGDKLLAACKGVNSLDVFIAAGILTRVALHAVRDDVTRNANDLTPAEKAETINALVENLIDDLRKDFPAT